MSHRKTLLAASIVAGLCLSGSVYAVDNAQPDASGQPAPSGQTSTTTQSQQTAAEQAKAKQLGTVTVVGIRNSEAESLNLKKAADNIVEVVTSEDIGKLPAKNVADTLQRLPGVNISSVQRQRRRFRRKRSRQPARHQPEPDPDPGQRPHRGHRRLVRA